MIKKIPYSAIIALVGAVVLILQSFGVKIDAEYVNEITVGVAGLLVTLGIVMPKTTTPELPKTEELPEEEEETTTKETDN